MNEIDLNLYSELYWKSKRAGGIVEGYYFADNVDANISKIQAELEVVEKMLQNWPEEQTTKNGIENPRSYFEGYVIGLQKSIEYIQTLSFYPPDRLKTKLRMWVALPYEAEEAAGMFFIQNQGDLQILLEEIADCKKQVYGEFAHHPENSAGLYQHAYLIHLAKIAREYGGLVVE